LLGGFVGELVGEAVGDVVGALVGCVVGGFVPGGLVAGAVVAEVAVGLDEGVAVGVPPSGVAEGCVVATGLAVCDDGPAGRLGDDPPEHAVPITTHEKTPTKTKQLRDSKTPLQMSQHAQRQRRVGFVSYLWTKLPRNARGTTCSFRFRMRNAAVRLN